MASTGVLAAVERAAPGAASVVRATPRRSTPLEPATCPHCEGPVPEGSAAAPFCCLGCREVYALLSDEGLGRYHDLAHGEGAPPPPSLADKSWAWLPSIIETAERAPGPVCRAEFDVQGVHCAACVWLMDELGKRTPGAVAVEVNPALGKVRVAWKRGLFDLERFLSGIERFGYRFGPSRKTADARGDTLLLRLGLATAMTMNVMLFSASFYLGLAPADGAVYRAFSWASLVLSTGVVVIGGWPFFQAAWAGLRRGVLHLDLPIAAGITLAYGTSVLAFRAGAGDRSYFDTLDTFVTLMLVGRWLQERLLLRNRRQLLDDGGSEGILVRRERAGGLETVSAPAVASGDVLLLAPGDLCPVDAVLLDEVAVVSTDWVNGESAPHGLRRDGTVPAGAFVAGRSAVRVRASTDFRDSPLVGLLRAATGKALRPPHARLIELVSRAWVPAVLVLASIALAIWWPAGPEKALDVTVALLVVTCPCALGLAVPLGGELALARLRRAGVFVRAGDLLDRLLSVRHVLFDKTGTLTLGRLVLADPTPLERLTDADRAVLHAMATRSNHPVSRALSEATRGLPEVPGLAVSEAPGDGLEAVVGDTRYRLGRPSFAGAAGSGTTAFSRGGTVLAGFTFVETMRPDAVAVVRGLADAGLDPWLVSGDSTEKVKAAAERLGIPAAHALAAQTPADKAAVITRLGAGETLFIGDGVNDALAFEAAHATVSPAVDRPVMPGKSDAYLLGDGIHGVRALFDVARLLRAGTRRNLILATAYNSLAIASCLAGIVTPLHAALFMPLSTLSVLALTAHSLGRPAPDATPAQGAR